ncbi:hypothetical protein EXIGLDRAFT_847117 [Exidia glandulosa HHB12029]|uniref:Uncharacterized protein n=1 Tax=Exidia glandulosa HHB12029 TaxID=1314781 RepID=A0A166N7E2_EXIGL|nr:hypothetical protein EXIGLDRAFT_847117 [Exidia glandulosa HHB12029]
MQFTFNFLALGLFAATASSLVIEKRGGGVPPPPPLCDRFDWLDISYGDIESGTAELGFKIPSNLINGQEYTVQLINIPTCTPQSEVGSVAKDFKLTAELLTLDETQSATYETAVKGATDITFPWSVPGNATRLTGDIALRFTTKKRPSQVNDLFNTYGPVLLASA